VVRELGTGALSVHPAVNVYLTLFRAGEGEDSEEEACHPIALTLLSMIQVGTLVANAPHSH